MLRRTKIVTTLGPATDKDGVLEKIILAGANVVRLNFSHGDPDDHRERVRQVRSLAQKHERFVAVLGDLQGPKIRIARFAKGSINLTIDDKFVLDAEWDKGSGNNQRVGIDYSGLPQDCSPGDALLLDDGRLTLIVEKVVANEIHCRVEVGGVLSNNKGINRRGGGLSAPALTTKDLEDIKLAAEIDVDYLAVSFPRNVEDINTARRLLVESGGNAGMVAKIERAEVVASDDVLDAVIRASDAVMVARGDLGVEIGDAELVAVQKRIISHALSLNKCVITATQMMESMITNPIPTRAEVLDVANAVLDGTDAVMLSAETAAGDYPVKAVEAMVRVINGAENTPLMQKSEHRIHEEFTAIDESIGLATMYIANHLEGVEAIVAMTETGSTPLIMSRINSFLPIYAFSRHKKTQDKVALIRGVYPVPFDIDLIDNRQANKIVIEKLKELDVVKIGDLVIVTKGVQDNVHGGTNALKVLNVS